MLRRGPEKVGDTYDSWCTPTYGDQNDAVAYKRYHFQTNGEVVVQRLQLQTNSRVEQTDKARGTWAIIKDQIFITRRNEAAASNETAQGQVKNQRRETDRSCMSIQTSEMPTLLCQYH